MFVVNSNITNSRVIAIDRSIYLLTSSQTETKPPVIYLIEQIIQTPQAFRRRKRKRKKMTSPSPPSLSRKEAESQVRSWGFSHVFTWTDGGGARMFLSFSLSPTQFPLLSSSLPFSLPPFSCPLSFVSPTLPPFFCFPFLPTLSPFFCFLPTLAPPFFYFPLFFLLLPFYHIATLRFYHPPPPLTLFIILQLINNVLSD